MEHFAQIRSLVSQVRDPFVRTLCDSFLDDPTLGPGFLRAPAATRIHHAAIGGLCEHTLSVMQLGWRICDHYPQLDRDLVTAGCLLHDIGKAREISPEPGFEYTDEGKLRAFVNLYLNDEDIRYLQKEATALKDGDNISIVPSIAGGAA